MNRPVLRAIGATAFAIACMAQASETTLKAGSAPPPAGGQQIDSDRPELAYLEQINASGPVRDPQLLFLLSGQFSNAGRAEEGIQFIGGLKERFSSRLSDAQKALYLTAIASLRAQHASQVGLLKRVGWARDTVSMLDEAKRLSGGIFVTRWMSGVVRAQLPAFFGETDAAIADLQWCEDNARLLPHPGWLREVYLDRARLASRQGDDASAGRYLARSGLKSLDQPITYTTPLAEDTESGHTFASRKITEPVPGRVYALTGFEFTEYYFVVSDDHKQLIGIDAGTRPDSAKQAFEALRRYAPDLPPLTTIFVTHAHWDHVGGHHYFRSLTPGVTFYGRSNYGDEMKNDLEAPRATLTGFFGERFDFSDIADYRPDVPVQQEKDVTIGGTRFQLVPTRGGETDDAMLINLPDAGVLFVGDIAMPYMGSPFGNEGHLEGLLQTVKDVDALHPRILLHGHAPLTTNFPTAKSLDDIAPHLEWLRDQVLARVLSGEERGAIQQENLVSPGLLASTPQAQLNYLVLRENVINRLYEQHTGYWKPDLQGMDTMTMADHGSVLVDYLGLSDEQIQQAAAKLIADGKHEQAAMLVRWVQARKPVSPAVAEQGRIAYTKLMEKYGDFSPFKFIVYAGKAQAILPQLSWPEATAPRDAH